MLIFLQISLIGLKRVRVDELNVASHFLSINEVVPLARAGIARVCPEFLAVKYYNFSTHTQIHVS